MRVRALLLCLLAGGLLSGGLLLGASPARAAPPDGPAVGSLPPQALGRDRDGEDVDLGAYRGKVVVVTFWASWCGYCLKELPVLDALQKATGDQWLKIVAVNVQDATPEYRVMLRQMRDFSIVLSRDPQGRIARGYDIQAYPNLWILDPQGQVAAHHVGYGEDAMQAVVGDIQRILTVEMLRQQAEQAQKAAQATATIGES